MKGLVVFVAVAVVLLAGSTASAAWTYLSPVVVPPPTVVHSYWPVGPVYAYAPPVVTVPARVVYRPPVVVSAPVVYPPAVVAPAPVVVRSRVYVRGQPVRNVIRAVLP